MSEVPPSPSTFAVQSVPKLWLRRLGSERLPFLETSRPTACRKRSCDALSSDLAGWTELTHENASSEMLELLASSYPVPRLGTALEVADLICFAASEAAGYLTGTSLDINGGDVMM